MHKPNRNEKRHARRQRPPSDRGGPQHRGAIDRPPAAVPVGRYDAPGDAAIVIQTPLTLQQPFGFDAAVAARLARRDVHPKEAFTLRDPTGMFFRASVKELSHGGGLAVPYEHMARSPEPVIEITLACAVLARQRMIFVMQKATELGVTRIVPLLTDHSVPPDGLEHERANAWPAQVVRAAKQCRRGSLPQVVTPMSLDAFLDSAHFKSADACVVLDDRPDPAPAPARPPTRVVLFVGPEGGFSDTERARLDEKTRPWFLGGRILRAETAVLVGLTAVHMTWGDFKA